MDYYHIDTPPTELKSVVLGREASRKRKPKANSLSDLLRKKLQSDIEDAEYNAKIKRRFGNVGLGL